MHDHTYWMRGLVPRISKEHATWQYWLIFVWWTFVLINYNWCKSRTTLRDTLIVVLDANVCKYLPPLHFQTFDREEAKPGNNFMEIEALINNHSAIFTPKYVYFAVIGLIFAFDTVLDFEQDCETHSCILLKSPLFEKQLMIPMMTPYMEKPRKSPKEPPKADNNRDWSYNSICSFRSMFKVLK